ncbi:hypothetical protein PQX77_007948 [Marasmius sp. AFHP31]|nr:hypothetical protein PQX77_007948 [Marasmius sp. AFHP31]
MEPRNTEPILRDMDRPSEEQQPKEEAEDQGEVAILDTDASGQIHITRVKIPEQKTFGDRELAEAFMLASEPQEEEAAEILDAYVNQTIEDGNWKGGYLIPGK